VVDHHWIFVGLFLIIWLYNQLFLLAVNFYWMEDSFGFN